MEKRIPNYLKSQAYHNIACMLSYTETNPEHSQTTKVSKIVADKMRSVGINKGLNNYA